MADTATTTTTGEEETKEEIPKTMSEDSYDEFDSDAGDPPRFWAGKGLKNAKWDASFVDFSTLQASVSTFRARGDPTSAPSLKTLPPQYVSLRELGNEAFRDGRYWEAAIHYTRALALYNDDPRLLSNRAAAHLKIGWVVPALQDAEACLRLDGSWVKALLRAGQVMASLKRYADAVPFLVKAHHLDPWNQHTFGLLQWARGRAMLLPAHGTGPEPSWSKARRAFGSGNMWAWGEGIGGVLGNGEEHNVEAPVVVNRLRGKLVVEVACGEYHVVAVTSTGECFAWGSNRQFQLGLGVSHPLVHRDLAVPVPIPLFVGTRVTAVACGLSHTLAVTEYDEVFAWGDGEHGQLGLGDFQPRVQPVRIDALMHVVVTIRQDAAVAEAKAEAEEAAAAAAAAAADARRRGGATAAAPPPPDSPTTPSASVYLDDVDPLKAPSVLPDDDGGGGEPAPPPETVGDVLAERTVTVRVACGAAHSAVTINDALFMFGWNKRGQLGTCHTRDLCVPTQVQLYEYTWDKPLPEPPPPVMPTRLIRVGGGFVEVPLTAEELEALEHTAEWQAAEDLKQAKEAARAAGDKSAAAAAADDDADADDDSVASVRDLGQDSQWSTASGRPPPPQQPPVELLDGPAGAGIWRRMVATPRQVACGACHTAIVDASNRVWTAGLGRYGQLGYDLDNVVRAHRWEDAAAARRFLLANIHPPHTSRRGSKRAAFFTSKFHLVPALQAMPTSMVACGDYFSVAVGADGTPWCFGRGNHGQLGTGKLTDCWHPVVPVGMDDSSVRRVFCRPDQVLATLADGRVLAWGMGLGLMFKHFFPQLAHEAKKHMPAVPTVQPSSAKIILGDKKDPKRLSLKQQYLRAVAAESGALPGSDDSEAASTDSEGATAEAAQLEGVEAMIAAARRRKRRQAAKKKPKVRRRPVFQAGLTGYVSDEDLDETEKARAEVLRSSGDAKDASATTLRTTPTEVAVDLGDQAVVMLAGGAKYYVAVGSGAAPRESFLRDRRVLSEAALAAEVVANVEARHRGSMVSTERKLLDAGRSVAREALLEEMARAAALNPDDFKGKGGIGVDGSSAAERARIVHERRLDEARQFGALMEDMVADIEGREARVQAAKDLKKVRLMPELTAGEVLVLRLQVCDQFGKPQYASNELFSAAVFHDTSNAFAPFDVHNEFDGTYRLAARPTAVGMHQVRVQLLGEHVLGSPFPIRVHVAPVAPERSEVFIVDQDGRRDDVEFRNHMAVKRYHHGFDISADPRVPSTPTLVPGLEIKVDHLYRTQLRVGVILRDAYGNEQPDASNMSRIVGQIRRYLSETYNHVTANVSFTAFHRQLAALAEYDVPPPHPDADSGDTDRAEVWLGGIHTEPSMIASEVGVEVLPLTTSQRWLVDGVPKRSGLHRLVFFQGTHCATELQPDVNFRQVPTTANVLWPKIQFETVGGPASASKTVMVRVATRMVFEELGLHRRPRLQQLVKVPRGERGGGGGGGDADPSHHHSSSSSSGSNVLMSPIVSSLHSTIGDGDSATAGGVGPPGASDSHLPVLAEPDGVQDASRLSPSMDPLMSMSRVGTFDSLLGGSVLDPELGRLLVVAVEERAEEEEEEEEDRDGNSSDMDADIDDGDSGFSPTARSPRPRHVHRRATTTNSKINTPSSNLQPHIRRRGATSRRRGAGSWRKGFAVGHVSHDPASAGVPFNPGSGHTSTLRRRDRTTPTSPVKLPSRPSTAPSTRRRQRAAATGHAPQPLPMSPIVRPRNPAGRGGRRGRGLPIGSEVAHAVADAERVPTSAVGWSAGAGGSFSFAVAMNADAATRLRSLGSRGAREVLTAAPAKPLRPKSLRNSRKKKKTPVKRKSNKHRAPVAATAPTAPPPAAPVPVKVVAGEPSIVGVNVNDSRGHATFQGIVTANLTGPDECQTWVLPVDPQRVAAAPDTPLSNMIRSFRTMTGASKPVPLDGDNLTLKSPIWAVVFAPTVVGEYLLTVCVDDRDIAGSPIAVHVRPAAGAPLLAVVEGKGMTRGDAWIRLAAPDDAGGGAAGLALLTKTEKRRCVREGVRRSMRVLIKDTWGNPAGKGVNHVRARLQRLPELHEYEPWNYPTPDPSSDEMDSGNEDSPLNAKDPEATHLEQSERLRWKDVGDGTTRVLPSGDGDGMFSIMYQPPRPGRYRLVLTHNTKPVSRMPVHFVVVGRDAVNMARLDGHWLRRKAHLEGFQAHRFRRQSDEFRQNRDSAFARILARIATEAELRQEHLARLVVKERQEKAIHERAVMRFHLENQAAATLNHLRVVEHGAHSAAAHTAAAAKALLWKRRLAAAMVRDGCDFIGGGFMSHTDVRNIALGR